MTWGFVAVAGATVIGGAIGASGQKDAAKTSAATSDRSIAEQRAQFAAMQELLAPYAEGGEEALQAQQSLIGLGGAEEQQAAIDQLEQSAQFESLLRTGEEGILQNASATGGLRGGNVQGALAQFRPQMLSNLIQQQYQNLGGITSLGQNAAAQTGNAGMQTGTNIGTTITGVGQDVAQSQIARAQTFSDTIGTLGGLAEKAF